jgi:hypothetical protein
MKNFTFPRSRIILPSHRSALAKMPPNSLGETQGQDYTERQRLLENSLFCGNVIRLVTSSGHRNASTTGIVKAINPTSRKITVETLEGLRTVNAADLLEIYES